MGGRYGRCEFHQFLSSGLESIAPPSSHSKQRESDQTHWRAKKRKKIFRWRRFREKPKNRRFIRYYYYKKRTSEIWKLIQIVKIRKIIHIGTNVMKMSDARANRSLSTSIDSALDDDHVNFLLRDHQVKVHSVDLSGKYTIKIPQI